MIKAKLSGRQRLYASLANRDNLSAVVKGTAGGGIDTSDATASASDIAKDQTAYVNGEKITGTVPVVGSSSIQTTTSDISPVFSLPDAEFQFTRQMSRDTLYRAGAKIRLDSKSSNFGDAGAADVAKGKTFTSSAGLKVSGTHVCDGGLDTSDATATAEDMAEGVTAYVNGEKVTGSISTISGTRVFDGSGVPHLRSEGFIEMRMSRPCPRRFIIEKDALIGIYGSADNFGDATASDVVSGKTFTSTKGLKITGTHVCDGGLDTSDADATASDIASGKTAYVNGAKVTGTVSVTGSGTISTTTADSAPTFSLPNSRFEFTRAISSDTLFRSGAKVQINSKASNFGDATSEDVIKGKTFTSAAGLKVIGSIETKSSTDLTASGKTVTVPAGYYATDSTKDVDTVTHPAPTVSVDSNGKITSQHIQSAGYTSGGTTSTTKQLTTKAAQTITPGTADQTIASATYLTGTQTIKGDANLVPANIVSGKTIFGVSGSHVCDGGLDTSDATATAEDMAEGVTAYVNGEKVTGSISTISGTRVFDGSGVPHLRSEGFIEMRMSRPCPRRFIIEKDALIGIYGSADNFGDATAADVAKGKTFTSAAGLKVTGTKVDLDTSDATATADDMASGVTAYVNGEKVTGTVRTCEKGYDYSIGVNSPTVSGNNLRYGITNGSNIFFRSGSVISMHASLKDFGDATAADVVAGKTFTSSAGLKVTGTHECSGGLDTSDATATETDILSGKTAYVNGSKVTGSISSKAAATYTPGTSNQTIASGQYLSGTQTIKGDSNLVAGNIKSGVSIFGVTGSYTGSGGTSSGIQAQHITSASDTITISGSGTVKVWGYGYYASGSGWQSTKNMYSFVGDGYYKGSLSYNATTPTKTSASFSISNGKLSGLPSNIGSLDVLVTIGV